MAAIPVSQNQQPQRPRFAALKFSKVSYSDLVDVASRRLELYQLQVGKHFFCSKKLDQLDCA